MEALKRESFEANVNTRFRASPAEGEEFYLDLIEFRPGRSTPRQEQFALLFRAPLEASFGQGTYRMEHDQMGEFELFLVPVRRDEHGYYYEAVFNRLLR